MIAFLPNDVTQAEYAVLFHAHETGELDPEGLAQQAAWDPPAPLERGELDLAACRSAVLSLIEGGLLQVWDDTTTAAEAARWANEPLPCGFDTTLLPEPGTVDLTEKGWHWCEESLTKGKRRFSVALETAPGTITIYADSPAAAMNLSDETRVRVNSGLWVSAGLIYQPGPVTEAGDVTRNRGWWYNRFHAIRPGWQAVLRYRTKE